MKKNTKAKAGDFATRSRRRTMEVKERGRANITMEAKEARATKRESLILHEESHRTYSGSKTKTETGMINPVRRGGKKGGKKGGKEGPTFQFGLTENDKTREKPPLKRLSPKNESEEAMPARDLTAKRSKTLKVSLRVAPEAVKLNFMT